MVYKTITFHMAAYTDCLTSMSSIFRKSASHYSLHWLTSSKVLKYTACRGEICFPFRYHCPASSVSNFLHTEIHFYPVPCLRKELPKRWGNHDPMSTISLTCGMVTATSTIITRLKTTSRLILLTVSSSKL